MKNLKSVGHLTAPLFVLILTLLALARGDDPVPTPNVVPLNDDLVWIKRGSVKKMWSENLGHAVSFTANGKEYNRIYEIGGQVSHESNCTRNVNYYDVDTATWTKLPDLERGISHVAFAVDGTTLWMAGGYLEGDLENKMNLPDVKIYGTTSVRKLDMVTNTWSDGPSLPESRAGAALIHLGHYLHFVSGTDSDRADVGTHYVLDLNGGTQWTTAAPLPSPRNHIAGLALDGKAWIVAGQTGQNNQVVYGTHVDAYDPATDSWTAMPDLPAPPRSHSYCATFVADERIGILGGLTFNPGQIHGEYPLKVVNCYDAAAKTWSTLPPLPSANPFPVGGWFHDSTIVVSGHYSYVLEGINLPHPDGLASSAGAQGGGINLQWANHATAVTGYTLGVQVERKTGVTGAWQVVGPGLPYGTTSWQDSNLIKGTTYIYRIEATATANIPPGKGISKPSNELTVVAG